MPRPNRGYYLSAKPNDRGCYEVRWTENGRSKRSSTGTGNLRQAQAVLADVIRRAQEDELETERPLIPTVRDVLTVYKAEHIDHLPLAESRYQLDKNFHLLTNHKIGDVLVPELVDANITEYLRHRAAGTVGWEDEKTGKARGFKKAGPATVRLEVSLLIAAMTYAVDNRKFPGGLTLAALPRFKQPPPSHRREHYLLKDQVQALLKEARCHDGKPGFRAKGATRALPEKLPAVFIFAALAFYTAQRKTAICELTWDRVLWTGLDAVMNFQVPNRPQTKKRRHNALPAAPELVPILRQAFRERTGKTVVPADYEDGQFRRLCKRVLGRSEGPHIMRHTWATLAAMSGANLHDVAGVLCDNPVTVARVYAKHTPQGARTVVGCVNLGFQPAENDQGTSAEQGVSRGVIGA